MRPTRALLAGLGLLAGLAATPRLPPFPQAVDESGPPGPAEAQRCLADLTLARARYRTLPDREAGPGCGWANAVGLQRLPGEGRALAVNGLGPLACPAARALFGWARYDVAPAAEAILGSPLARIETFGTYSCRNVAGSPRRSAHARANAIDIAAFVLADGRRIGVARDWPHGEGAEGTFLRRVHAGACRRFGTVLGPDYNAAHADHLHLEVSGRRLCR